MFPRGLFFAPSVILIGFLFLLQKLCSAMAVIQHLTHTAMFTWMLVEGIHLYIKLVKVFSVNKLYIAYFIIGWGKAIFITKRTVLSLSSPLHSRRGVGGAPAYFFGITPLFLELSSQNSTFIVKPSKAPPPPP